MARKNGTGIQFQIKGHPERLQTFIFVQPAHAQGFMPAADRDVMDILLGQPTTPSTKPKKLSGSKSSKSRQKKRKQK